MRRVLAFLILLTLAFLSTACNDLEAIAGGQRYKEDFHKTYNLKPGGRLLVENENGSIELLGWESNTVDVTGTKYASTETELRDIRIDIVAGDDSISIRTIRPFTTNGNSGAKYVIRVPRKVELDRIQSSNGSIRAEGFEGSAHLMTTNGSVRTSRLQGRLEIQTSNGGVDLDEQVGETSVRTTNGGVRAEAVKGTFEATTTNGSIHVHLDDPEPQRTVKLETTNGAIDVALAAMRDNSIRAHTTNSSITVHLPMNAKADLHAHTSRSSIGSDFDLTPKSGALFRKTGRGQGDGKHDVEASIGGGGARLDLSTSNGRIEIKKL